MSYLEVPTRTSADTNSSADINQLQANINAMLSTGEFSQYKYSQSIVDGWFRFWYEGTSFSPISDGEYASVNAKYGISGTTVNVSRQSFTVGQTDVPGNPDYYLRTVVASAGTLSSHYSKATIFIEDVSTYAGTSASISFWAKADSSKNISVDIEQYFGSGGSATVTGIGTEKIALTSSWQYITLEDISFPSISGKTVGAGNHIRINLWHSAGADYNARTDTLGLQTITFDIARFGHNLGTVAIPAPKKMYSDEFLEVSRFYYILHTKTLTTLVSIFGKKESNDVCRFSLQLPCVPFAAPSITYTAVGAQTVYDAVGTEADISSGASITNINYQADCNLLMFYIDKTGAFAALAGIVGIRLGAGSFTFDMRP